MKINRDKLEWIVIDLLIGAVFVGALALPELILRALGVQ